MLKHWATGYGDMYASHPGPLALDQRLADRDALLIS
jgi:hypothetical protein